jgi:hypothetical protein
MNFTPPVLPYQLAFSFIESPQLEPATPWERLGVSRSYFTRRKLQCAVDAAYELCRLRHPVRPSAPAPARITRPFQPTGAEARELEALARRIERPCVSHRSPEIFVEDKSEIAYEMRTIAARVNGYARPRESR